MHAPVLLLIVLNFALIGLLPRIFFRRDGTFNARWCATALPFGVVPLFLIAAYATDTAPLTPRNWLSITALAAVVLSVASIALIFLTLGTHRIPVSLWHQDGDAPQHLVTYGAYRRNPAPVLRLVHRGPAGGHRLVSGLGDAGRAWLRLSRAEPDRAARGAAAVRLGVRSGVPAVPPAYRALPPGSGPARREPRRCSHSPDGSPIPARTRACTSRGRPTDGSSCRTRSWRAPPGGSLPPWLAPASVRATWYACSCRPDTPCFPPSTACGRLARRSVRSCRRHSSPPRNTSAMWRPSSSRRRRR